MSDLNILKMLSKEFESRNGVQICLAEESGVICDKIRVKMYLGSFSGEAIIEKPITDAEFFRKLSELRRRILNNNFGTDEPIAFDFGEAIKLLKEGKKVSRKGWNGKRQYVVLASGISFKLSEGDVLNCEHNAIGNKALAFVGTSGVQMGWLASQADMLAEDWVLFEQ